MEKAPVLVELDFDKALAMNREELREKIAAIEAVLKEAPQVDLPVEHFFSKGAYVRKMPIPQGALIVGKIHKFETTNIISKGRVSVLSQDGVMTLEAGDHFVSTPGAKRVIFAHEDSIWSNVHGTDSRDLEEIENHFIAKDYSEVGEALPTSEIKFLSEENQ